MRLLNRIRLDKKLDVRLERLARLTGRNKSYYVNRALEAQIQALEERIVAGAGSAALLAREHREVVVPLYELERALGADD